MWLGGRFLDVILRSYKTIIVKKIAEFLSSYHEGYKLFSKTMFKTSLKSLCRVTLNINNLTLLQMSA